MTEPNSLHKKLFDISTWWITLRTLFVGCIGGIMMTLVGFPAAFLTGPALVVSICSFSGMKAFIPVWIRQICFCVIGVSIGSGVDEQSIAQMGQWPLSLGLLTIAVLSHFLLSTYLVQRVFDYDRLTSMFATIPGHMSLVVGLSVEKNADAQMVVMVQSLRILFLTLLVPAFVLLVGIPTYGPTNIQNMGFVETVLLCCVGGISGWLFMKIGSPAPMLVGPMVASTIAHLTGFATGVVPNSFVDPAILVVGCLAGSQFKRITFSILWGYLKIALIVLFVATLTTVMFASMASWFTAIPLPSTLIAFAPGGLEAMIAMGSAVNADPAFIASHHLFRLFLLTAVIAFIVRK